MSESDQGGDRLFDASVRAGIERSVERAHSSEQTRWVGHVIEANVADALRCYAHAGSRDRFFWERVDADEFCCAWGSVHDVESGGTGRFDDVRTWASDIRDRIDWIGCDRPPSAATFVGGFGFEEEAAASSDWKAFPPARFILPEVIVERRAGRARWVLFARVEPGATPEVVEAALSARMKDAITANRHEDRIDDLLGGEESIDWLPGPEYVVRADRSHAVFANQIRKAIRDIEEGAFAKVVLARSLSVDHDDQLDVVAFLGRLRLLYPTCTLIAVGRAHDTFLAATPETLVRVEGRSVDTAALAGSAPRGRQPEEDRALAEGLLASQKENAEHAHVVAAIRGVLAPRCDSFEIPDAPCLRPLFGIQHLETRMRGRLRVDVDGKNAVDVLELVEALHPTPAVGGVPSDSARAWLRRFEGLERGWYAAPIGWLDIEGGGDFRVALRSALIRNELGPIGESGASRAFLFAGAGIVGGSEPASELAETRTKLRALLAPLTEI